MKRKFLILLLSLVTAICCVFGLTACTDINSSTGSNNGNNTGGNEPEGPKEPELELPPSKAETLLDYKTETEILTDEKGETLKDENNQPVTESYIVITGIGKETKTDIVIPATINKTPVKAIADGAFTGKKNLTSVTFAKDSNLTTIGENAFTNCNGITTISLPATLTTVGTSAFRNCTKLVSVDFGEKPAVKVEPEEGKDEPEALEGEPEEGQGESGAVKSKLTAISVSMFEGCSKLTSITIPESVKTIGEDAFTSCIALTDVELGIGVQTLGKRAFRGCTALKTLDLTSATSLTNINDRAFEGNTALDKIIIPNSVQNIGKNQLAGCTALNYISVPFLGSSRASANDACFGYLFGAENYSDNNDVLRDLAGKSITVKVSDVTDEAPIRFGAFYNVKGVATIIVEGTMTTLKEKAFGVAPDGVSYVLPETLTRIEAGAFAMTTIGKIFFAGAQLRWNSAVSSAGSDNANLSSVTAYCSGSWHYDEYGNPKAN
ncbi:MAG: leucine-rich repeat protein [Clostridiales bacterium]|nr:leucine-rich repeat protein [Clostridiales bacterium]